MPPLELLRTARSVPRSRCDAIALGGVAPRQDVASPRTSLPASALRMRGGTLSLEAQVVWPSCRTVLAPRLCRLDGIAGRSVTMLGCPQHGQLFRSAGAWVRFPTQCSRA